MAAYGGTDYDFTAVPQDGGPLLGEHLKKNLVPMQAVNDAGLPFYPGPLTKGGAGGDGDKNRRLENPLHHGPRRQRLQERVYRDLLHRVHHGLLYGLQRLFGVRRGLFQQLHRHLFGRLLRLFRHLFRGLYRLFRHLLRRVYQLYGELLLQLHQELFLGLLQQLYRHLRRLYGRLQEQLYEKLLLGLLQQLHRDGKIRN